ncbi:MAG: hypothetical protein KH378_02720 [Butyrivibrio sp.]|nr:hypothetical protein [Butyrivibrio sp.]
MNDYKIYPKQFKNVKIPIEKNRCFFIMPFAKEFDIVYGELKSLLGEDGYICTRVDEISGSTPIINKILTELLRAQFVIVDLTNCNPNVFYELGIAHTFKDAENIFLLKQKGTEVPFDVIHLTYNEYETDNLIYLSARLKKFLKERKFVSDFDDILNIKGIIGYSHDNQDELVDILHNMIGDNMSYVLEIMQDVHSIEKNHMICILDDFEKKLKEYVFRESHLCLSGLFDFYAELLISYGLYYDITPYINRFVCDFFLNSPLGVADVQLYKIDFMLKLAKNNCCLGSVMPWIIQYFRNSKFGTIDLNRYKLESFLLTTDNKEVNNMIILSMTDRDCHIREHFADMIGEKKLVEANDILCKQLLVENNYFTAASIIEAMGKLEIPTDTTYIKNWLEKYEKDILNTKNYFVLKHIRIALSRLDSVERKAFDKKYIKYLGEFIN